MLMLVFVVVFFPVLMYVRLTMLNRFARSSHQCCEFLEELVGARMHFRRDLVGVYRQGPVFKDANVEFHAHGST